MTTIPESFAHLEVHSHYTLLGSTLAVDQIVAKAVGDGLGAIALTDTNVLYGQVSFVRACVASGVKPIIGMAVDMAMPPEVIGVGFNQSGRLVLLANGRTGYRSLCKISSHLQVKSHTADLALDWETLKECRQGLICVTGGRHGWIERFLRIGQPKEAARIASRLGGLFEDKCYLGILPNEQERELYAEIISLGQRFGLPPVAVQPIYCHKAGELPRLKLLQAIDRNCLLEEVPEEILPNQGNFGLPIHWPTFEEMAVHYLDYPDALTNVAEIVNICEPGLPDGTPIWPVLPSKKGRENPDAALEILCQAGMSKIYPQPVVKPIQDRLAVELQVIRDQGFAPLFLIVADIVNFARRNDIPVNTRGSVANSLTAYVTGITNVDPIAHDLLFERFLNPARSSLPDIDLDFCSRRRDEVLSYLRSAYGDQRMALVATISTFRLRSAIRETAKAYGLDGMQIKKLAELIPQRWHPDPSRRQSINLDEITSGITNEADIEIIQAAYDLVGYPHHLSIHPGGIILTPGPLTDVVPVQMAPKGFLITQFDYRDLELIGLPKIDLLGIRALTVLADASDLIREFQDPQFKLNDIPLNDRTTSQLLQMGNTVGVFQCESSGARRTLRQLKAATIEDLAVANAFFKPGPATGGMAKTFIRRYRGESEVKYLHPALEPILSSTQGVLLFQEQILRIAREIAGLTWEQADGLRKGMSKFQPKEMAAIKQDFITGCQRSQPDGPGFSADQAKTLWEQVSAFAGYGFNKGHATAYADVSYRSAYLKAHYPAEFLCARLADRGGFHHPAIYMAEARRLGIAVQPPHVNASRRAFSLTYGYPPGAGTQDHHDFDDGLEPILWMGLGQVRELRKKSVQNIVTERKNGSYSSLADFLTRVALQDKEIRHLIQCGALDGLESSRAKMLVNFVRLKRAGNFQQLAFDFSLEAADSLVDTPIDRFEWEKKILGLPVSIHPVDLIPEKKQIVPVRELQQQRNRKVMTRLFRLPGWTGGKGFYGGDGDDYVVVILDRELAARPPIKAWQLLQLSGYWREDEWGGGWFQADMVEKLVE